ncbi:MAG: TonB-dependent receptor [Balneolaceae bacterium]
MKSKIAFFIFQLCFTSQAFAQLSSLSGTVTSEGKPVEFVNIYIEELTLGTTTDIKGQFEINRIKPGNYTLRFSYIGFETEEKKINISYGKDEVVNIQLRVSEVQGNEIVVTGTLKAISRSKSPVPVEVFSPSFFKMNPTPSLYDAMQNVNGVRPQLNCNVCNTGDIHINGLEGPYTMVLIDGMPIVSGLSTVYGLSGIPNSMIERVEIVKGPSSSLYGSEAVGGLINVITKKPSSAPTLSIDMNGSSWSELNLDLGGKFSVNDKADVLTGVNLFNYTNPIDNNGDGFTDMTIQQRVSLFQKWSIRRSDNRLFILAGRFLYEDRWGGEMEWKRENRGGNQIYGESIYTRRWEMIGNYQLPTEEKLLLSFSYNNHYQDSYYGDVPYFADQQISFAQLTWDTEVNKHSLVFGAGVRYTYYDDNTPATASFEDSQVNNPEKVLLPGIFAQDNISIGENSNMLLGLRYDYNSNHGNIWTPRMAYKWSPNVKNIFRLNLGTGFRVVNLFTEEHAALTGAREVLITEELKPEQSYNVNLNYERKFFGKSGHYVGLDITGWYTYFTNQILPDYETNTNQIIYDNLDGYGVTQGISLNVDVELRNGFKVLMGGSYIDVFTEEADVRERPLLTEKWTGTWGISYTFENSGLKMDYTGNLYSPMKLPLLNEIDPRDAESTWWSIQNIQLTWVPKSSSFELYTGVKNLLNFTPPSNSIARPNDPFDKQVDFDGNGNPVSTLNNPYALTFDPAYVFAPNQGARAFFGFRYIFN